MNSKQLDEDRHFLESEGLKWKTRAMENGVSFEDFVLSTVLWMITIQTINLLEKHRSHRDEC
jgi:hypothetical protein